MKMLFKVTAELTGLAYLEPEGKVWTDPSLAYNIKLRCERCGWCTPDFMRLCMEEPRRRRKKGIDHIICECADCGRRGAIGIRRQMGVPLRSGVETTVMLLDCDGLVPLDGEVGTDFQWTAVSEADGRESYPFNMVLALLGGELKWQPMQEEGVHMEGDMEAHVDSFVATFSRSRE